MATNKSLVRNTIYYFIYQVINILFPFFTAIYIARVMLPEVVGKVTFALNISNYFAILAFLGIPTYGIREIAKIKNDKEKLSKVYSELFIINFFSTFIFSIIYIFMIFSSATFRDNLTLYLIMGLMILLNLFNNTWLFEGLEEFQFISLRNILFKIFSFVCLLLFVHKNDDVLIYAAITVLGAAGNNILNIFYSSKLVKFQIKNLDIGRHLKSIFMLALVNLAIELYSFVDVTMLGLISGNESVAYYSYAQRIVRIILQVLNTFTIVIVPRLSFFYAKKESDNFNKIITDVVKIIILFGCPIILGIFLLATNGIIFLYGNSYYDAAMVLKWLAPIVLISPLGYLLGSRVLLVSGHELMMSFCVSIGAIVNIMGNFILIQKYAHIGAAISSLVSEIIVSVIYIIFGKKFFKLYGLKSTVLNTIFGCFGLGIVIILISKILNGNLLNLICQICIGGVAYFGVLLFLRENFVIEYWEKMIMKIRGIIWRK